jgi:diadenosine tetraphosphate (Ap4A) HIT family hydrolase
MSFALHPRLAADTAWIADWPLSRVLLMNDSRYPWIVLVPRHADATELFQLDEAARTILMGEIARAGEGLNAWASTHGGCDKINVGAIGNLVPQLHIHVVARRIGDAAWPQPVWGKGEPVPYSAGDLTRLTAALAAAL